MKTVGKIVDISLGHGNTAEGLLPISNNEERLVLGQFALIGSPKEQSLILAKVLEIKPDFGEAAKYDEALRDSFNSNTEVDKYYKKELGFLRYKFKLLGVVNLEDNFKFYSDVRYFKPIHELSVILPSEQIMCELMKNVGLFADGSDIVEFELGELSYGSNPENKSDDGQKVPVVINVKNMLRRRTAVFGQSGYGKSNLVKAIVGMIAKNAKGAGQLLIDTNGEYSLTNSQNDGFLDIFHEANMKDKVVVFTNRNVSSTVQAKYEKNIRPLRIDAYSEPSTVFTIVAEAVRKQIRNSEVPGYLLKWVLGAETEDVQTVWDSVSDKGTVWAMYYAALNSEGIKPQSPNKKCDVGTYIKRDFIAFLMSSEDQRGEIDYENFEITDSVEKSLTSEYHIIKRQNRYFTNHVSTMIEYGKWFAENMPDDSELKDYKALVVDKSYRLAIIKKLHIQNQSEMTHGLSQSVFKALKEGKIVILDLALESVKVADVLTRHILNYLFTKMSEDFSRPEIRKEFEKRDILVYLEESQNYLSEKNVGDGSIYERLAKEGRKFNLGLVYITQAPASISQSITSQTENIFALHLSNEKDTYTLKNIKDKFDDLVCRFIKDEAVKGLAYVYMEPYMPFVIPVKVRLFNKELILSSSK